MVREKSDFREHLNRTRTIFRRNLIDAPFAPFVFEDRW